MCVCEQVRQWRSSSRLDLGTSRRIYNKYNTNNVPRISSYKCLGVYTRKYGMCMSECVCVARYSIETESETTDTQWPLSFIQRDSLDNRH